MDVKKFKPKNKFDQILGLNFSLRHLKMNLIALIVNFTKDYQKTLYNKNILMEKDDKNLLVTFKNIHGFLSGNLKF
jgi:hypothetical protein